MLLKSPFLKNFVKEIKNRFFEALPVLQKGGLTIAASHDHDVAAMGNLLANANTMLLKNNDIANAVVNDLLKRVTANGIIYQPIVPFKKSPEENNKKLLKYYKKWCETTGGLNKNFYSFQDEIYTESFLKGEFFILHNVDKQGVYTPVLLSREACPTHTNNKGYINGIKYNALNAPISYIFGEKNNPSTFKEYPAKVITHFIFNHHLNPRRGIPAMTQSVKRILNTDDYSNSVVESLRLNTLFLAYIRRNIGMAEDLDPNSLDVDLGNLKDRHITLETGVNLISNLLPGEELVSMPENRTAGDTGQFIAQQLEIIAASNGVSPSALKAAYDVSYAAFKAEMADIYLMVYKRQNHFVSSCLNHIYKNVIQSFVLQGIVSLSNIDELDDIYNHQVFKHREPTLDPGKKAGADNKDLKNKIRSKSEIIMGDQRDPIIVAAQIRKEEKEELDHQLEMAKIQKQINELTTIKTNNNNEAA